MESSGVLRNPSASAILAASIAPPVALSVATSVATQADPHKNISPSAADSTSEARGAGVRPYSQCKKARPVSCRPATKALDALVGPTDAHEGSKRLTPSIARIRGPRTVSGFRQI